MELELIEVPVASFSDDVLTVFLNPAAFPIEYQLEIFISNFADRQQIIRQNWYRKPP